MSAEYDFNFWDDEKDLPPIPEGFEPVRPPAPVVPKTAAPALELPPIPEGFEPFQPPQAETATAPVDLPPIPEGFEPVPTPAPATSITTPAPALEDHPAYHTKDETVRPTDDLVFKGQRFLRNKFGIWNATTMMPVVDKDVIAEFQKSSAAKAFADQASFYQKTAPVRNFATEAVLEGEDTSTAAGDLLAGWEFLQQGVAAGKLAGALEAEKNPAGAIRSGRGAGGGGYGGVPVEVQKSLARKQQGEALQDLTESTIRSGAIPEGRAAQRFNNAASFTEAWNAFLANPTTVARSTILRSAPASMASVVGGIIGSAAGPLGSAAGAGSMSYMIEVGSRIQDELQRRGADLTDANSVRKIWTEQGPDILRVAQTGAAAVAAFDTLSAGVGGALIEKMTGGTLVKELAKIGAGAVAEAPFGAAGEAAAQVLTQGGITSPGAIAGEFLGDIVPSTVQAAGQTAVAAWKARRAAENKNLPAGLQGPGDTRVEPRLFPEVDLPVVKGWQTQEGPQPPAGGPPGPVPPPGGPTPPPAAEAPVAPPTRPPVFDQVFTDPEAAWKDIMGGEPPPAEPPPPGQSHEVSEVYENAPAEPTQISTQFSGSPPPGTAPMAPRAPPPAAPIPPPGFVETRGEGERYHGTAAPIGGLDEGHYGSLNYYGQGFYTSDAFDITHGYTKKGRRRGEPATPSYYKVEEVAPVNAFDMEQPIPDFLVQPERDGDIYGSGEIVAMALDDPDGPKTVRELYDYVREYGTAEGMTADTIQEQFESFRERFMENGYGAIDHIGGLRTGRPEHKVRIYLDPANQVRISTVNPEGMRAQPVRRISFEAAPGEGSPYAARFGEAFSKLHPDKQARVTRRVTAKAAKLVERLTGHKLTSIVHGTGGWQHYQNPAAVSQTVAPREVVEVQAAALGYLLQQTEVWVNHISDQQPNAHAVDFMEEGSRNLSNNDRLREFWKAISDADTSGLIQGYQPITDSAGRVGIRVLVDQRTPETLAAIEQSINGPIEKAIRGLPYVVVASTYNAGLTKHRNDWTENPDGQAYLQRLTASLGGTERGSLDSLRGELEAEFAAAIGESEERATRPAPEVIAARKRLKGLELLLNCVSA